jgi:hypothetical protein
MNRPHIIALTGPAGCGKDTVADLLATHAGYVKLAFADPLRTEIQEAFDINAALLQRREHKEMPTDKLALNRCRAMGFVGAVGVHLSSAGAPPSDWLSCHRSPRQIMQWWGTEYRRRQNTDYWTAALAERIKVRIDGGQWRFVVSDLRFPNEAKTICDLGGAVWQVKRPGYAPATTHSSDTDGSALKPSVVLNNSRDIPHLQRLVLAEWWARDTGLSKGDFALIAEALAFND